MAVATNKARQATDAVLNGIELNGYFDIILSRDEVELPKPAPDMLLQACHQLSISPDRTMMLGDTDNDILAAKAAEIKSCLALWGFSDHYETLKPLSTYAIEHPLQLLDIIESKVFQHA